MPLLASVDFFKNNFIKIFFQEHYQSGKRSVGPNLGPNCFLNLSADDKNAKLSGMCFGCSKYSSKCYLKKK